MRVLVHDNLNRPHHSRTTYVSSQLAEKLARLQSHVHCVEVTLSQEGHSGAAKTHCHATAHLGGLGVVTADCHHINEHQAVRGVVARLVRGIARRVDIQQQKQKTAASTAADNQQSAELAAR